MTDDARRKRNFLLAVVGVVVVIGIVGVLIALTVGSTGDDGSAGPGSPTLVAPGHTVESLCAADQTVAYAVNVNGAAGASNAAAVAKPWILAGETTTTVVSGSAKELVAIGRPGATPREVLTVVKDKNGWAVSVTTACLDAIGHCGTETLTVNGRTYRRMQQPLGVPGGVAAYVGQATLQACVTINGRSYAARDVISPVTVYTENEQPARDGVVLVEGHQRPFLFAPIKK